MTALDVRTTNCSTGPPMSTIDHIEASSKDLVAWRRDFHANPEIGFQEARTSALVAERLAAFGCEVHRAIGGTGVVGVLRSGNGAAAIGLRADMDALPIEEIAGRAHGSRTAGVMHACGHDGHTTMLLGAARYLAETRNFDGTVNFIFQPAEEGLGGAKAMLDDGLFQRFPCDSVFGMHNAPGLPAGRFAIRPGVMMAAGAMFDIHIEGRGAHGARPEDSIDPVLVACHIATALQAIVSRNITPHEPAALSITSLKAGEAYNVIPQTAHLRGTARAFSDDVMAMIESRLRATVKGVAEAFGASANVEWRLPFVALHNDPAETDFIADTAADLVGETNVQRTKRLVMASEDFSYMLAERPGAYINIGNAGPDGSGSVQVHNPAYDFNDAILTLGASLYARIVERKLPRMATAGPAS